MPAKFFRNGVIERLRSWCVIEDLRRWCDRRNAKMAWSTNCRGGVAKSESACLLAHRYLSVQLPLSLDLDLVVGIAISTISSHRGAY